MRAIAASFVCLLMLTGCLPAAHRPDRPLPVEWHAAAVQPASRAVIVLPGRSDDLAGLRASGIADAIHAAWPDADVLFVELSLGDYTVEESGRRNAPQRLHDEVMPEVRRRAYREVWLSGASLGGMGTLLYDRTYPGDVDGLILLAPYLGDADLPREIVAAGGLRDWNAGPPAEVDAAHWQRELWRHLQTLTGDPTQARRVWVAWGNDDPLRAPISLFAPALPATHALEHDGGHRWTVWTPAMGELLRRIDASRR